jgi:hypothetical protein
VADVNGSIQLSNIICNFNGDDINATTSLNETLNQITINIDGITGNCSGNYVYTADIVFTHETFSNTWNLAIYDVVASITLELSI